MSHPFQHPLGRELLKRVAQLFHSEKTYILRDSNIVFVCGGRTDTPSMRSRFLKYADAEMTHLRMFLAEAAERDYVSNDEGSVHNVAEFEEIIGEVSDCLVIFPESPGSYAELGYFAKNEVLREKILVVNDIDLQGEDSFILRGPIHLIDRHSRFAATIQIKYGDDANFKPIKDRLENRVVGKQRKKFAFTNYAEMSFRNKFFAVFEIIRLFEVLSFDAIEYAFKSAFAHAKKSDLAHFLSIMVAADLVRRCGDDQQFFCINRKSRPFMDFESFDHTGFRLQVTDFYEAEFPEIAVEVRKLST